MPAVPSNRRKRPSHYGHLAKTIHALCSWSQQSFEVMRASSMFEQGASHRACHARKPRARSTRSSRSPIQHDLNTSTSLRLHGHWHDEHTQLSRQIESIRASTHRVVAQTAAVRTRSTSVLGRGSGVRHGITLGRVGATRGRSLRRVDRSSMPPASSALPPRNESFLRCGIVWQPNDAGGARDSDADDVPAARHAATRLGRLGAAPHIVSAPLKRELTCASALGNRCRRVEQARGLSRTERWDERAARALPDYVERADTCGLCAADVRGPPRRRHPRPG